MPLSQEISFCTTRDGIRIATASVGQGPTLVWTTAWLSHLEHDLQSPWVGPMLQALAAHFRVVRYDSRGNGLSQREVNGLGIDAWVSDMEAVVSHLGLSRFALYGLSQGAAVALSYAARHPEHVDRMVLHGGCARGLLRRDPPAKVVAAAKVLLDAAEVGWGQDSAAFRQMFLARLVRTATLDQLQTMDRLQRLAISGQVVRQFVAAAYEMDVTQEAGRVRCPTLVAHADEDPCWPFSEGALLASLIPGSKLITLHSKNHLLVPGEPAVEHLLAEVFQFLGADAPKPSLTPRQIEVLGHVARGLTDKQVARELGLSPRTVEMHVARAIDALACHTRAECVARATEAGLLR